MTTNPKLLLVPVLAVALAASACGGSSSSSTTASTNPTIDTAVFKKNAELYSKNLKSYAADLGTCASQALTSGKPGEAINACLKSFTAGVTSTTKELKSATDQYLKGVSGPCRSSIQKFQTDASALGTAFGKVGSAGDGSGAVSAAIATLSDPETQAKLTGAQVAFNDALKTCADLAKAK